MFKSVGRVVGHHPVRVILAWVAIVLGIACLAAAVVGNSSSTSQQQTDFLPSKYESVQAAKLVSSNTHDFTVMLKRAGVDPAQVDAEAPR